MRTLYCETCQGETTATDSRVVWLKDEGKERRVCGPCLRRRGLSLTPRAYRKAAK